MLSILKTEIIQVEVLVLQSKSQMFWVFKEKTAHYKMQTTDCRPGTVIKVRKLLSVKYCKHNTH